MKTRRIIGLLAALFIAAGLNAQTLPDVKVEDLSGKTVSTKTLIDGKTPFIVTFWASWCNPCMMEMAALEEAVPGWKPGFPVRIYAVSIDDSRSIAAARTLAASSDWPVTVLFDTKQHMRQAFKISSIPQVFVFDKNGKQVYTHIGYNPGSEQTLLEKLIEAK